MTDDAPPKLSNKQRAFVEAYIACGWNATEAARRAGYAEPDQQGPRLLGNVGIRAEVSRRLDEAAMPANEVLARLSEHARATMDDFLSAAGAIDLKQARERGKLHLIKSVTETDKQTKVELHDAQAALALMARHHGLLVDRTEVSGKNGAPIEVNDARSRLLDRLARRAADDESDATDERSGESG